MVLPSVSAAPAAVIVVGPSGTGKNTIGLQLAQALGWSFFDGDDSAPNTTLKKKIVAGWSLVLSFLVFLKAYRDVLLGGGDHEDHHNHYHDGGGGGKAGGSWRVPVFFFFELRGVGDAALVVRRLQGRQQKYMKSTLLTSQYAIFDPLRLELEGWHASANCFLGRVILCELHWPSCR